MFFDDNFKESVKVTNVQKCDFIQFWTLYFQNFLGGACPQTSLEGLKKFFLTAMLLKNFFQGRIPPPPKQEILDRTLANDRNPVSLVRNFTVWVSKFRA